jgi:hypothetical protein
MARKRTLLRNITDSVARLIERTTNPVLHPGKNSGPATFPLEIDLHLAARLDTYRIRNRPDISFDDLLKEIIDGHLAAAAEDAYESGGNQ